jgi:hypothetical protein
MSKSTYPLHFWQIHKKVYQREWLLLDWWVRDRILSDIEGPDAKGFFKYVESLAVAFFEDENHNYNSRFRFQYAQ